MMITIVVVITSCTLTKDLGLPFSFSVMCVIIVFFLLFTPRITITMFLNKSMNSDQFTSVDALAAHIKALL